jgi:diacylglycerol kinase family enzyme
MKEITIICNPAAGSGKAQKKWNNFQSELESSGVNYRVFFTAKPQHATKLTLSAIENGSKRIVSFGGDGTLNEIIQGILINKLYPSNEIDKQSPNKIY